MIKVDFEFETKYGKFADALRYPEDTPISEEKLEAEKQRRQRLLMATSCNSLTGRNP